MKKLSVLAILLSIMLVFAACGSKPSESQENTTSAQTYTTEVTVPDDGVVDIKLGDKDIVWDSDAYDSVCVANDIIYYEEGKDFTYGEGIEEDSHSAAEASAHTVVHITKAGTYRLSGKLSKGQIAVDLGKDAKEDPNAVVTLILDGVDITCDVAPAVIFYNVYECSSDDADTATKDVDTSKAGANVIIADESENNVNGSYVAKIYKPDSVVLSDDGTEVEDAKKLHKYDGAFYSRMSMNINGGENSGVLNIKAENEGIDSELHLTVNGGNINICSGNDGINTNEDYVSVTTINGGNLTIDVTGETGEGDGIDSNGWLVINGGVVLAEACSFSADTGIDSDMGIHINGGTVIASGNMLDRIEDGGQFYVVFNIHEKLSGEMLTIENSAGKTITGIGTKNDCSVIIYSSPDLDSDDTYALYSSDTFIAESSSGFSDGHGMPLPPNGEPPQGGMEPPGGHIPPEGEPPHWN